MVVVAQMMVPTVMGLPDGITVSYSGGVFTISGTPSETGTFNFIFSCTVSGCTVPQLGGTIEVESALPIELLSFKGKLTNDKVELQWTTVN